MASHDTDLDLIGVLMKKSGIIDNITETASGVNMFLETFRLESILSG